MKFKTGFIGAFLVLFLLGCTQEDNSPFANRVKYDALHSAYQRCIGFDRKDFDSRLKCTSAVYGGN